MRLGTDRERVAFIGRTGSGKTHEALSELSQRSFDKTPWILFDFKKADLLAATPVNGIVTLDEPPPTFPGLWYVSVRPNDLGLHGKLDRYLSRVVEQGRTGVFIDEGHLIYQDSGRCNGMREIITTGRSARVPLLFACQRPVHIDTFVMSEIEIFHLFLLQHPDDYDRFARLIDPEQFNRETLRGLPDHHSFRYEFKIDQGELLPPGEDFDAIRNRILTRLPVYEDEQPGWIRESRERV